MDHQHNVLSGPKTAFSQRDGTGPCLVCIHGNSLSKDNLLPLWEEPELRSYPMVTYDLPGHGDSGRLDNPIEGYTISGYAEHLVNLVESLNLESYIFIGVSLGGHIALEAAAGRQLSGLIGLFLIGTPLLDNLEDFPEAFIAYPDGLSLFNERITEKEAIVIAARLSSDHSLHSALAASILSTDPEARGNLMRNIMKLDFHAEKKFIKTAEIPVSLVFGENDKIINPEYIKSIDTRENPLLQIKTISGGDHLPDWAAPDGAGMLLKNFIQKHYG